MTGHTLPTWTVAHETGSATSHVVVIEIHSAASTVDRDRLLTSGVVEAMTALVQSYRSGRAVVLDVRPAAGVDPGTEAYIEAIRGLVQSFVLEIEVPVRPVNVVVSTADQAQERARTLGYLCSKDGTFSCGATYDLREGLS